MPTKSLNTKKIIVVVGPTATNKTNVAIALAKELNGEIVNADAFQVYRELNIGVNKPSTGELKQAPFHLIGNVSIKDKWDIKRFQKEANTIISGIYERKHIPIVVGGSHLYVDALILSYDLDSAPERDNSFDNLSIDELIAELKKYDTELVDKIGKNHKRLVRALQIANFTSVKRNHKKPIYNPLYVLCIKPREQLYEDINKRVDQMIKNGWYKEVSSLVGEFHNYNTLNAFKAIGYLDIAHALTHPKSIVDIEKIKRNTRHYAKRQLTWIRHHYTNVCEYRQNNLKEIIKSAKSWVEE